MNEQMEQLKFQLKEPEPINEEELKWRDSKIESLENEIFELKQEKGQEQEEPQAFKLQDQSISVITEEQQEESESNFTDDLEVKVTPVTEATKERVVPPKLNLGETVQIENLKKDKTEIIDRMVAHDVRLRELVSVLSSDEKVGKDVCKIIHQELEEISSDTYKIQKTGKVDDTFTYTLTSRSALNQMMSP